jgi:hypothetical protein
VVVAAALLALRQGNNRVLVFLIFVGPFVKEQFIFIAPILFFFSKIAKWRMILYLALSGCIVFAYRGLYDHLAHNALASGLTADLQHVRNINRSAMKLFSVHTLFLVLMNTGVWILAPIAAFYNSNLRFAEAMHRLDKPILFLVLSVLLQTLLSGSIERMLYLAMPAFAIVVALSVDVLLCRYRGGVEDAQL